MACCWLRQPGDIEFHNYEEIIKDSGSKSDNSSKSMIYEQLKAGIFWDKRKQKYWVDKKSNNKNCFMIFANGLEISHGKNPSYWNLYETEDRDGRITVAELKHVWWLEAKGRLNAAWLSPGVTYEVAFLITLREKAFGWETPVNLVLKLPHGEVQRRKESLGNKKKEIWHRILVGEFKTFSGKNDGEIEFVLNETEAGTKKGGLVIKGVIIQPKSKCCICPKN